MNHEIRTLGRIRNSLLRRIDLIIWSLRDTDDEVHMVRHDNKQRNTYVVRVLTDVMQLVIDELPY